MPVFNYTAKDKSGNEVDGQIEGESKKNAIQYLKESGLSDISVKSSKKGGLSMNIKFFSRVTTKEKVVFSRQLAVMISANVPLLRALRSLVGQTENVALKDVVKKIADDIEGGAKLSDALAQHPDVFSEFFVSMVRSGETTGKLDEVLNYLADEQEKDYELMSKIKGSMIYPAFIICGLFAVGILMMVFVIPKLTQILTESGAELPWTTRALIFSSSIMQNYWWALLIALVALVVGIRVAIQVPLGRYIWDNLKVRLPIFGGIFRKIYIVRFTRSMGTLISGGVDIISSLKIVSGVLGNATYRRMIYRTIREVEEGNSITTVFRREDKLIPPMVTQMMTIGEETGQMTFVLGKLTNFFAREVRASVDSLVTIIEPMIMVVMGIAVGIMVSAVIMPMYNLASAY